MSHSQAFEDRESRAIGLRVLGQLVRDAVVKQRELIAASEDDQMLRIRLGQLLDAQDLIDTYGRVMVEQPDVT